MVVLIPNHSRIFRQNNADVVALVIAWKPRHLTSSLLLVSCRSSKYNSSPRSNHATHAFAVFHVFSSVRSRNTIATHVGSFDQWISLRSRNLSVCCQSGNVQIVSTYANAPGWCRHASSKHATHEPTIWSISAHGIQQSNNLSERLCCFSVQFFFIECVITPVAQTSPEFFHGFACIRCSGGPFQYCCRSHFRLSHAICLVSVFVSSPLIFTCNSSWRASILRITTS